MLRALRRRLAPATGPEPGTPLPRSEYKAVWTAAARTLEDAKAAVAGPGLSDHDFSVVAAESREILQRTVGIGADDVVLEVGCGVGRVGRELAGHCREWIGCDVSPSMLAFARELLADSPNVRLVEISGFDLAPIEDASVDVVYCTVVFMHLDEWDRYGYVEEARRVLRPGGRLYVDNFNLCSDDGWSVFERLRAVAPADRPSQISKSSTPQELRTYLERAGFAGIEVLEDRPWVRVWGHL
jgi:SAM-dependent methyltransferase